MRWKLLGGAAVTVMVLGSVGAVGGAPPASAVSNSHAVSAVNYANQHGYRSSIGVFDTQTGSFAGAGDYNSTYASESVMKVFIATRLLMTGQMSGWNETTAYKMITQSDDASANALYGRTGGDGVLNWVKQALNIPNLGSPPLRSGWWGGTQITAAGMASFYNAVRHRPAVWNWLGNAMHHATQYGSDGTYQYFGIPSATTAAAIKQGWGGDNAAGQPAFNSTGLVNGDRYAVVILTQGGVYGSPIAGMLTSEARLLMPAGNIANDNPVGGVSSWSLGGRVLTVSGWALDPNATSSQLRIVFYVNGKSFTYVQTTVPRGDINSHYGVSGTHGFSKTLSLNDGANTVCAYAINLGAGSNTTLGCRSVPLSGSPLGGISKVTQKGNLVTFTGWSFDYDAPGTPLTVVANADGRLVGSAVSNVLRPDINAALHGTGLHGYSFAVRVPAGSSTVCLHALNQGHGASETRIGCAAFRVSLSPIGRLDSVTVHGNQALVTGWTFDFSNTSQSIGVVIDRNGKHVAWGATTVDRGDVNKAWSITGKHGYSWTIPLLPGANKICAYGVNIGVGGLNPVLGCRTVSPAATAAASVPVPAGPPVAASRPPIAPSSPVASNPAPSSPVASNPAPSSPIASNPAPSSPAPSSPAPSSVQPSSAQSASVQLSSVQSSPAK